MGDMQRSHSETMDTSDNRERSLNQNNLLDESEQIQSSEEEKEEASKNIIDSTVVDSAESDDEAVESADMSGGTDNKALFHRPLPKRNGLRKGKWTVSIVF